MKVKPLLQSHVLLCGLPTSWLPQAEGMLALETLLAFAQQHAISEEGADTWLCRQFGLQSGLPVAPYTAMAEGLMPGCSYWLRADPVHLQIARDRLIVADCGDITQQEADTLAASLNQHFSSDGLRFHVPSGKHWYIELTAAPNMHTCPLVDVLGQDASRYSPEGTDAMTWQARLNEVQMLLHGHGVNQHREEFGHFPINSVWLWGGGMVEPVHTDYCEVWADTMLARGLAQAAGIAVQELPVSAKQWSMRTDSSLLVLDCNNDSDAHAQLAHIDTQWLAPMIQMLRTGKINTLHLHIVLGKRVHHYSVQSSHLWKIWKSWLRKPLEVALHG